MTATTTEPETAGTADDNADDLDHYVCVCDPDTALCGKDVSDDPLVYTPVEPEHQCVVCEDLAWKRCPRCGY